MAKALDVFIGYDSRQADAAEVCRYSMETRSSRPLNIRFLKLADLAPEFNRPFTVLPDGQYIDDRDEKPFSTEFSFSRFLVPHLMRHSGHALFCDGDFLFLSDPAGLFDLFDPNCAVQVVKHHHDPAESRKMDGVIQTRYRRKNWSSCVLWNCGHRSNDFATPYVVNRWPGAYLHAFDWLHGSDIGELPGTWNWIPGVSAPLADNEMPHAVHFSLGGPWFKGYESVPFAEAWYKERALLRGAQNSDRQTADAQQGVN